MRGGQGQASPTCPFWMSSSLPQRASRPLVTLRCIIRLLPSAHSHAHRRVAGDACGTGGMGGLCAKALWLTVKASQCGWPCGWRDGCVCGWLGWLGVW